MEIGMVAYGESERLRGEGNHRIVYLVLQAVYKGTGKGTLSFRTRVGVEGGKGGKDANQERKNSWPKAKVRK